jgi:hypothetical protein
MQQHGVALDLAVVCSQDSACQVCHRRALVAMVKRKAGDAREEEASGEDVVGHTRRGALARPRTKRIPARSVSRVHGTVDAWHARLVGV